MEAKQGQDAIIRHIAQVIAQTADAMVAAGDSKKRAKRDLAADCKALEISSVTAGYAGSVASEAASLAGAASIFGLPAAAVASGVAVAAYTTQFSVDIAHIELGCDDIPFNEIKEIMDERFNKMDKAIDRNYDAIVKVDQKVDKVLSEVQQTRIEMRQGFKDVLTKLTSSEIRQTLSDLKTFVTYFDKETARIYALSEKKYIARIKETTKFLDDLNEARRPGDKTLYSIVYKIINRDFANPQNAEDTDAWSALFSLYYAAQSYVSVVLFLVKQHARLADYYYNDGDVEKYNVYFDELQIVFENFKETLAGNSALIDRIVEVMERVKAKKFVGDNKDLRESLNTKIEALKKMEVDILQMELPIITDDVDVLNGYSTFDGTSPIDDWKSGGEVSYALQYKTGTLYSKIGDWTPFRFQGQANPVLRIPGGPEGRQKLIFRKFNNDKAQLVGVLDDENELEFPDINRDLYNAASYSWKNNEAAKNAIETLIQKGVNMNARFEHGRTAIHAAAEGGSELVATILLEKNPSYINKPDDNGYTPIHIAAERGDDKFIALLIKHKVDVNAQTYSEKLTALHLAARNGFSFAFKALQQAKNINIYARDIDGFTPLHLAVSRGLSFVQNVLQNGNPEINAKTAAGMTLLHMAAMSNNLKFADSLARNNDLEVNSVAADDFTPLHFAVIAGHLDMVQFLLQHGANVNAPTSTKWTPLHFAVTLRREDIVTTLLAQENIKIDPRADGSTPFHLAVGTGQVSIAQKLLAKRARIQAITKNYATPLHIASMHRNLDMVEFLLNNNAKLEAKVPTRYEANIKTPGYTPLLTAALVGNLDIVQYLVNRNANINATERGGDNVLHIAAKNGHLNVVKFLENHFDVTKDSKVLQSAINGGQLNIVRYLVDEKKMDVNNEAIFKVAVDSGHPNIIKYLITEKNYNVTCDNPRDCWYLNRAARFGYLEMVQHLTKNQRLNLHQGAIPEAILNGHTHILDYFLDEKLMTNADLRKFAVNQGYISSAAQLTGLKMVKYLAVKANVRGDEMIRHALDKAIQQTNLDMIKYLVKDVDINRVTLGGDGDTVLHSAVAQGISGDIRPVLRYLVDEKGANVNAQNRNGNTALDDAIKHNFQSYPVQFLVSRGGILNPSKGYGGNVNSNINDLINNQPGCNSIIEGKQANKNFLSYSKCIDTTKRVKDYDIYFTTPLILAISKGNLNLANQLIDSGADIHLSDVAGNTPLHVAAEHGYLDLTNKLIQKGADVTVENKAYKLPLILAYENYNKPILDALNAAKLNQPRNHGYSRSRRSIQETASPINVVNYLKEHGCRIRDASEKEGTPLCLANLNGEQQTTEFKNPLCLQNNLSLGLLLLQNFLDKRYPLPRFTEMNDKKSRTFALQITFKFEKILRKEFKVLHAESNGNDFYKLYREIEANIRKETFSNIPKLLVDFVNGVCTNENTAESVVDKIGKWFSKV